MSIDESLEIIDSKSKGTARSTETGGNIMNWHGHGDREKHKAK